MGFAVGWFDHRIHLRYNVTQVNMATTEMVHVRIDKRTKTRAAKALAAMGLSVSDAVRVLLTRVATERALPFEVKAPNAATAAAMQEARNGKLPSFRNVRDLMADLNADD
jgi:DNA-damage-inducible protein J